VRAALAMLAALAGCLHTTEFKCDTSSQCGPQGVCESTQFCSFPDDQCGRRYGASAGSLANQCVGGPMIDGGIDGAHDGATDSPASQCPAGFGPLAGAPHQYLLVPGIATWNAQQAACTGLSATTYLAIPDDAGELGALDTLAGATVTYWVGISDSATEGTWRTVKGGTQTFLPWETGHPTTTPPNNQDDCVRVVTADAKFFDDKCNTQLAAICECE
jgi:Lectin C-type domain